MVNCALHVTFDEDCATWPLLLEHEEGPLPALKRRCSYEWPIAYCALDRPGRLPEHRPGTKYEHGLLAYCAFVEATALSSVKGSLLRWGSQSSLTKHYVPPPLTGRRDGPAPSLFFSRSSTKKAGMQKRGALHIVIQGITCFCKCADVSSDQQRAFLARRESRSPDSLLRRRRIGQ